MRNRRIPNPSFRRNASWGDSEMRTLRVLVHQGASVQMIADRLGVPVWTVRSLIHQIAVSN